jgi:hypothetical protein
MKQTTDVDDGCGVAHFCKACGFECECGTPGDGCAICHICHETGGCDCEDDDADES